MSYFIYILECSNGSYYTGYTKDIHRRYQEHCDGSSKCKYTRSFPPKRIAACWKVISDLSVVLKIEREIKSLTRSQKLMLIKKKTCLKQHLLQKGYAKLGVIREKLDRL